MFREESEKAEGFICESLKIAENQVWKMLVATVGLWHACVPKQLLIRLTSLAVPAACLMTKGVKSGLVHDATPIFDENHPSFKRVEA